ncbi:hypothetical protein OROGR_023098 [Orobanche gracilis]
MARILVFKISPSQEILKIRDGSKRVARILVFKIRPSQEILKIRDGTPLEAEEILIYRKKNHRNGSFWHFSSKLDVPSNVLQKNRVARILVFKIRPSQEILKIRDGTPLEAEEILKYRKKPSKRIVKNRVARILVFKIRPSQEILKIRDGSKRVARIMVFKIRPSQKILKIRDGTPLEAEEILTYKKSLRNGSVWHFSSKLHVPSNVLQKKRVARILVFKIRPSQEILKIRDDIPLEAKEILIYRKKKKRVARILVFKIRPSQEILKIRDVARILVFKIRPSQEILKIRDGSKRVARILVFKIRPSQKILKIRDGTPLEAKEILTYKKSLRNGSVWHFSSKLHVPSNVLQKKRVARILVFKIRPSQEILKIRDGTPLELDMPSQKILKIRDSTPLEAKEILTYKKSLRNGSVWHFSIKLHVPSNVLQKKRVARILVFKIRPSQEILKIRDGTPLEMPSQEILKIRDVARILVFKIRPSQKILKIRDGTPLEAEEILTYKKSLRNGSVWHFSSKLHVPSNVLQKKRVARILVFKIRPSQEILKIRDAPSQEILKIRDGTTLELSSKLDVPSNVLQKKRVAWILVFKIRTSQEILKIRDGTPLEAEEILKYKKSLRNGSVWHFSSKLHVPSNVLQKKRVARILVFKIRPSQEILKIRDGTPLEAEEILKYRKKPSKRIEILKIRDEILKIRDGTPLERVARILVFKIRPSQEILKIRDVKNRVARILVFKIRPSQEILKIRDGSKRVARILVFKIRPSQKILKIRDGTPLEAKEILTYKKSLRNGSVWHFSSKLHVPSNVLQKKRVARILVFKIRPSQEILKIRDEPSQKILKIRDGTPLEAKEILTYKKSLRNGSVWHFSSKLHVPSNVLQKKRVARILVFKIRPSQEILKIRDGTPLENRVARILVFKIRPSQEILKIRDGSKRVARILVFKIRPSQKILKIRDGTPLEAEEILTYKKSLRNGSVWHFSSKLHVPSNVLQKKRVARILVFKIRPSQEILKIRDGIPLEAKEILIYRKNKKRVARILVFKIRPSQEILKIRDVAWILVFKIRTSQEILKIRDGTPLEAEEILKYKKSLRNGSVWHFSSKLHVPSNVLQKKRVARILVFKIRPSQEILKIRDGTPLENRVARILVFKIRPSQEILKIRDEILKIRDGTPLERVARILVFKIRPSQEILKIRDVKNRVARILVFKIRPSQEILKIRDGSKRVARILVFKIRPSQKILKIRDGTPLEAKEILTYKKSLRNGSVWHFSSKLHVPSNVLQKKRVARILVFKIRPSQEILKIRDGTPLEMPSQKILKIRDGTPLEAKEILTYKKSLRNGSVWHFSSKLHVPSNVLQKKSVARILVFKIRPSQEILKIRDVARILKKRVAWILVFKIRTSQEILKIRDGTPLEAEEILKYKKSLRNGSVWHFSSKLHVPSNVLQKKRVARILVFKIRPSQEILKIRDGTPLEAEEILKYRKKPSKRIDVPSNVLQKKRVARILVFRIRPSQEILKIRDGTTLEAEEILTYRKNPRNGSIWQFSSKLDVPSNVLQKKRVARILVFKIRSSQKILKIRDGTPLEAEEILTYKKSLRNGSVWHFSSKLHVPSNVLQKKRVARILVFKIRPSQEILKIRDGIPLEAKEILIYRKNKKRVARILVFKIRPSQEILKIRDVAWILVFKIRTSQEILKIRDGTPLEAEEILKYKKSLRNGSVWHFSSKLHVPSNVLQKKRVARILVFKIRPSQEILKIRDGTPLEAEEILKYRKKPSKRIVKKRVARILVFRIRPSQEILKIRDGTTLEAEEILTYRKNPRNGSIWQFSSKLDVPSNVLQKKRVARILVFKIRSSQKILKIRDGTPLEAEEILTYKKSLRNGSVWHFSSKLHVPSNVLQKKRVARILVFKIRPSQEILKIRDGIPLEKKRVAWILVFKIRTSQEILKIRDGTPLEAEEILKYKKSLRNGSVWHFSSKLHVPSNVLQKKRVARILVFKIRPSQEILKIRDGTPLEAEEILKYRKKPSKRIVFSSKLDVPSNVLQKKRVARILVFKIRPSQKILKIRDGTPLEAEEILTYKKGLRNGSVWHFSSKLHVPSNVLQKKRVARILVFKIMPSQEILKIRDGIPLEAKEIFIYRKKYSKWISLALF